MPTATFTGTPPTSTPTPVGGTDDWTSYLHDQAHTNDNTAETTLSPANASSLSPLWSFATGGTIAASAIEANGTVFVGSWDGYEYALSQATGALLWRTFLGQTTTPQSNCNPPYSDTEGVTSSPTLQNGVVYLSGGDSYFYALDATTGTILWKVLLANTNGTGYYNYSSPVLANGFAYVGLASSGDCPLVQGAVVQIDLTAHVIANRFNVVSTVGGGVWSSPVYDPATNTILFTTGNNDTNDPYIDSILALNAANLAVLHAWMIPSGANTGDADFGASPTLFSDSTGRALVGAPNKGACPCGRAQQGRVLLCTRPINLPARMVVSG
jgi:outer membrane protein assembly factor BamB